MQCNAGDCIAKKDVACFEGDSFAIKCIAIFYSDIKIILSSMHMT